MTDKKRKYRGFLFAELVVSLTILGVILAGLAMSLDGIRRLNDYQLVRQRCVSAAQAELDSIAITGKAIDESDFERLWPKMTVSIEQSQGAGQWEGMQLVRVTTSAESSKNKVEIRLSRYFASGTGR
ncbi:MAG: type II secretion system protein [Planctomycetota bacterium]